MSEDVHAPQHANGDGAATFNGSTASVVQPSDRAEVPNGTHKTNALNGSSPQPESSEDEEAHSLYFGHDREEVTRILIQALADLGYQAAAENIIRESGYTLESPAVAALRTAVLDGSWADAEALLTGAIAAGTRDGEGNGLVLAAGADVNLMRFRLRQQKFLELLEQRDMSRALAVLRGDLTPLSRDTAKLHFLSSMVMCRSAEDLLVRADWDGAKGESRKQLLSELSGFISPAVMLPERRLAFLLEHVKQKQIDGCLYHTTASAPSLYSDHHCDRRHFPSEVALVLSDVMKEVWQVQFSHDGSKLAACGTAQKVIVWDTRSFGVVCELTGHESPVANLAWSPDDQYLVTCSLDHYARLWNLEVGCIVQKYKRLTEPVTSCAWAPNGRTFVLGTLDKIYGIGTVNREEQEPQAESWAASHRVKDLCLSNDGRWLVAIDDSASVFAYHAATRKLQYSFKLEARPMSVCISEDSRHVLVNRNDGEAQLIDLDTKAVTQKFMGHTGGDFVIRGSLGGANESFATSGSDDGNVLIWHKNTGAVVERLPGHFPRCNAISWNSADPCMLASCGDDGTVKM